MSPSVVVITVAGEMSAAMRSAFDDVEVSNAAGVTRLTIRGDPAAVNGVIHRLEALGLELLDLQRRTDPDHGPDP